MASQLNCTFQKVASSATQDNFVTVRVTRKWEELNFMSTNNVTSVDIVIVDEEGAELHAVIPNNLIWKFDKLIREGCLYCIEKLHLADAKPKFRPANKKKTKGQI
ncbi:hypothetical protein MKX01_003375 [Papaver californicum]|nr:hypothetical protein MKX01_003375 [Papaver californicum]